jgi:predicted dehydrogenase
VPCEGSDGYGAEIAYMLECVAQNRPPKVVTGQDGLMALEICEAEEKSIRTGQPVAL